MQITPHFSKEELERSATAQAYKIDNSISEKLMPKALVLCQAMETVRAMLRDAFCKEIQILVSSGYRCPRLNTLVKGQPTSQHMALEAMDFTAPPGEIHAVWETIKRSALPYDQLILEHDRSGNVWVHYSVAREGRPARRMAFELEKA